MPIIQWLPDHAHHAGAGGVGGAHAHAEQRAAARVVAGGSKPVDAQPQAPARDWSSVELDSEFAGSGALVALDS